MNEKVHELLNQQINKEFYSAYLYLDFSNYFKARGLDGFANWYLVQAQEERDHAMLSISTCRTRIRPSRSTPLQSPIRRSDAIWMR